MYVKRFLPISWLEEKVDFFFFNIREITGKLDRLVKATASHLLVEAGQANSPQLAYKPPE